MTVDIDELRLNEVWEEGFDAAIDFYDGALNEMHRALHPNESLWYTKCYQSPCKDL